MFQEKRRTEILSTFQQKLRRLPEKTNQKETKIPRLNLRLQQDKDNEEPLPRKKAKNSVGIQCFQPEEDQSFDISAIKQQHDKFRQLAEIDDEIKQKRLYLDKYKPEDCGDLDFEIAKLEYELSKVQDIDYHEKLTESQSQFQQNIDKLTQLTSENKNLLQLEQRLREAILNR